MESTGDATKQLFLNIGIDPKVVDSTLKNKKVTHRLKEVIEASGLKEANKTVGNLFYALATKLPDSLVHHTSLFTSYIVSEKFVKLPQLDEAIKFVQDWIRTKGEGVQFTDEEFALSGGVGIVITDEDIQRRVDNLFEENAEQIKAKGYDFQFNNILYKMREEMKWADQKKVIEFINAKKVAVLGEPPAVEEGQRKKKNKAAKEEVKKEVAAAEEEPEATTGKSISDLIGRDINSARNSEELLKKHREVTGGKVVTRFPPEPNGFLHIGHAKAMRFNFTVAKEQGGYTFLRFDDTNPVKENQEFIDNINTCVNWLGYTPAKVTHASEYFDTLYELACELIRRGKAYVCHQKKADVKEYRNKLMDSPFRNRTVEENLKLFEMMKQGRFEENECCLRMKIDMTHVNPCMRDPTAYRIRYHPHPHVGDKWCIYPTYDYTHCINDSLENITHSLCTLEFEIRRESYYWLLEALDLYRPFVWEYSRLNLTYTIMSKRKLEELVRLNLVEGWEDPRMPTILGLKRRGYTPSMINEFCEEIGVSRKGNENVTSIKLLEFFARRELDREAPRTFGVLDPILLEIVNYDLVKEKEVEAPLFPVDKSRGSQKYVVTKQVYIDAEDFSEVHKKGFYGLSPEQAVCLKYGPVVSIVEIVKEGDVVKKVLVQVVPEVKEKLKGYIHWVSAEHCLDAEVRLYGYLFTIPEVKDDYLNHFNKESYIVKRNAKVWTNVSESKELDRFQFERIGYFVVDRDSRKPEVGGKLVFNRVVDLKESKEKKINTGK